MNDRSPRERSRKQGVRRQGAKSAMRVNNLIDSLLGIVRPRIANSGEFEEVPTEILVGEENEERALLIIKELAHDGLLPESAQRARICPHYSLADVRGVDILIPTDKGDVGIQIKSSYAYLEKFLQKHPDIPSVVVNPHKTTERLKIELNSAFWHGYHKLLSAS